MCGICGAYSLVGAAVDKTIVERMNECLAHRGPDDSGLYTEPSLVLGHRRLSIIDLSAAGRQPMSNGSVSNKGEPTARFVSSSTVKYTISPNCVTGW